MRERVLTPRGRGRRPAWLVALPVAALSAALFVAWPARDDAAFELRSAGEASRQPPADNRPAPTPPLFTRLAPAMPSSGESAIVLPSTIGRDVDVARAEPQAGSRTDVRSAPDAALGSALELGRITRLGDEPALSEKDLEAYRHLARPGYLGADALHRPLLPTDVRAPQLTPDVEVAVSDRTKLGIFGQVGQAGDRGVVLPHIVNRPVGAGVTLEYRFGTK